MKAQIVSFNCVLKNKLGKVISSTFNHDVITQAGSGNNVLKGLADGMQDLKKGEKRLISLSAEKAYGFYDPGKVIVCPRDELSRGQYLRQGDQVVMRKDNGEQSSLRVVEILEDSVTLDGNHPLAGQDLVFEIEATQARDATAEEIRALDFSFEQPTVLSH
jgi:FKBP-type peptidyl-prolyl cis-trans isomerase SlyD